MSENPLHKLMSPKSLAWMGASNNTDRMGSFLLANVLAAKFPGPIYPVHPEEDLVLGLKAYKQLKDLPEVPELLVLVIPTTLVPEVMEQAGQLGIDRVIVVTAGYDEIAESEGRQMQKQIDEIVKKYGIRYVGPNCIGVYNGFAKLNTTPMPNRLSPGKIGMISHSGTYLSHVFTHLERYDFNFGEGISLGNAASIDLVDAMEYFGERDEIDVIAMYIEGLRRPRDFFEKARKLSLKKPLIALYVGGTEGGARASATHTAALSGPDHLFDAVFRQTGVVRAYTIEELLDFAWAFSTQPLPKGDRMAVISVAGGPASSMADSVCRYNLELPRFPKAVEEAVLEHLPHTGGCVNPIDITYTRDPKAFFHHIPKIILECDEIDGILIYGFFGPDWLLSVSNELEEGFINIDPDTFREMGAMAARQFSEFTRKYDKPILGSTFQPRSDLMIKTLRQEGIPLFPAPERAVKAMAALCSYQKYRESRAAS